MNKTKLIGSLTLLTGVALTLTACGNNSNQDDAKSVKDLKSQVPVKTAKTGGSVSEAIETDTPFTGIFSNELSNSAIDSQVSSPANEALFDTNDSYKFNNKGPATIAINEKAKTVTINIKNGVKWSDGKQVTAKDVEYSYEITANPKSTSQRYTDSLAGIEGMAEYHEGKATTISGIEMPNGEDGQKVVIHFNEMKPGMTQSGNGFFNETAVPYHYLKGIPFDKLESSDKIRKEPLYFGPYKLSKLVRGQSVTYVPNKYYWRGTPKLDKITLSVISKTAATQAIKSNKYDIADVVNAQWPNTKNTKNVNFVSKIPLEYSYLGFKVGKWDGKTGKNVMNPNAKMNNKSLRQAMAYGMNIEPVTKRYSHGLEFQVPTLIPKQFGDFFNPKVKPYTQDIKKGNELLDKAGYKKKGKWRVQPNGKPLTITIAAMSGQPNQEAKIQNYIQQWHKLGLNVKLSGGRLTEFNSFYDKVLKDDPSIDMFVAAWSLSSEPSPSDLYSENAQYNLTRFVTSKNTDLLGEMNSEKAFNNSYRVDKFHEWQKYMSDEAYVVPMTNSYTVTAVNNKLTGYSTKPSDANALWYNVAYSK